MKKVTAFLIALVLFIGTAAGLHMFMDRNMKFDPHSFGSWISRYKFFASDEMKANMNKDTMLVLGSSEFRHGKKMSSHPANLFEDNSFNMMMVGAGYYQSLFHTLELTALAEGVKNKKVVLILSPQWFKKEGVLAPAFASRFSEENFIAMIRSRLISQETKNYIVERSKKLLSGDPQTLSRVERYERVYLTGKASFFDKQYVRFYRGFLKEKSKVGLFTMAKTRGVKEYDPKQLGRPGEPDWAAYEKMAQEEGERAAKGNPFYVSHRVYEKQLLPNLDKKKDSKRGDSYSESPEYDDLRCFLQVCRETGIEPMLVLMPVNGYWYDHIGFPRKERQQYYENIRALAKQYGAQLSDLGDDEYTKYFFLDKVHLGWKGWLAVNEDIYRFAAQAEGK